MPDKVGKAEEKYGGLFDLCFPFPEKLTLLKIPYDDEDIGEEVPAGLKKMLRSRGHSKLVDSAEVIKTLPMRPYEPDWDPTEFFTGHFEPLLKGSGQGHDTVFFVGPGSAYMTAVMTQLAFSMGAEIIANAPHDESGVCQAASFAFVTRGIEGYRSLFAGLSGRTRNDKTRRARNVLVKLLDGGFYNGRWAPARALSGGRNRAEPLGVSKSIAPLSGLIDEEETKDGKKYSLNAAGLVAAIETKKHHERAHGSPYDYDDDTILDSREVSRARGVITGVRALAPDPTFDEHPQFTAAEYCDGCANGAEGFDPIALVLSHISSTMDCKFSKYPLPTEMAKAFLQRDKTIEATLRSVCGPDWDPELHFTQAMDSILKLDRHGVYWYVDVTGLINQDQIVFSLIGHLLKIPIRYRMITQGVGAGGRVVEKPAGTRFPPDLHELDTPSYSVWRMITELAIEGRVNDEVSAVLDSMQTPDDFLLKEDYDRIMSLMSDKTGQIHRARVEDKLQKDGIFTTRTEQRQGKADLTGWALTRGGRILWAFLQASKEE